MRPSLTVAIGLALVAVGFAAPAQEFPKLRSGLWEVNTTAVNTSSGKKDQPRLTTMCLDDSVQREMYTVSTGMMSGMCSKHEIKVAGSKVTTLANCDLGITKMQSQAVMTLTGNTAYHTEARAKFDPPLNGAKESSTIIDGKHVGACKPGQQPGDMTLPGGQTLNVRQLMMGRPGS